MKYILICIYILYNIYIYIFIFLNYICNYIIHDLISTVKAIYEKARYGKFYLIDGCYSCQYY